MTKGASSAGSICIRPGYLWPVRQAHSKCPTACDEGWSAEHTGSHVVALLSGCGPSGADVAVTASQLLAGALSPSAWPHHQHHEQRHGHLVPSDIEFAFQQCHQQLLQLQQQQRDACAAQQQYQQQQQQQQCQQQELDSAQHLQYNASAPSTGGLSSCGGNLPNPFPLQQQRAPACPDVTWSGTSALLVALDQAEHKLLVASAGLCKAVLARRSQAGDLTVMELAPRLALGLDPLETARLDAAGSSICYSSSVPGGIHSQATDGSNASFTIGAVTSPFGGMAQQCSGVDSQQDVVLLGPDGIALPGVGASRLLGFSAASKAGVLPDPVLTSWRMNGAESFAVLGTPGLWAAMNPAEVVDYVAAVLASGVCQGCDGSSGLSVGDLLTLEAQERLKLKLADSLFSLCSAGANDAEPSRSSSNSSSGCGRVPDVSAVVLLLEGSQGLLSVGVDREAAKAEIQNISRACRSNLEARTLQSTWAKGSSSTCSDRWLSGPPAPAVACLLPALTVAGSVWPSSCWPSRKLHARSPAAGATHFAAASASAVAAGAGAAPGGNNSSGSLELTESAASAASSTDKVSLEDAAAAAGVLSRNGSGRRGIAGRASTFMLSPRLSCELDLSHDHACGNSCSCFANAADCCAPMSDSPTSEQSMIVHKVRLSGPGELESLLFGSATTSYPNTTVARILRPQAAAAQQFKGASNVPQRSASVSLGMLARGFHSPVPDAVPGKDTSRHSQLTLEQQLKRQQLERQRRLQTAKSAGGRMMTTEAAGSSRVMKARSYQALSALQAAKAAAGSASSVNGKLTCRSVPTKAGSDAHLIASSSSGGGHGSSSSCDVLRSLSACSSIEGVARSDQHNGLSTEHVMFRPAFPGTSIRLSLGPPQQAPQPGAASCSFMPEGAEAAAGVDAELQQALLCAMASSGSAATPLQRPEPLQPLPLLALAEASSAEKLSALAGGCSQPAADAAVALPSTALDGVSSEGKVRGGVPRSRSQGSPLSSPVSADRVTCSGRSPTAAAGAACFNSGGSSHMLAPSGRAPDTHDAAPAGDACAFKSFGTGRDGRSKEGYPEGSAAGAGNTSAASEWMSLLRVPAAIAGHAQETTASAVQSIVKHCSSGIRRLSEGGNGTSSGLLAEQEGTSGGHSVLPGCPASGAAAAAADPPTQQVREPCVRGGLAKASRLMGSRSTPDLQQLAKECAGSDGRIRGGARQSSSGQAAPSSSGGSPDAAAVSAEAVGTAVKLVTFWDALQPGSQQHRALLPSQSSSALLGGRSSSSRQRRHSFSYHRVNFGRDPDSFSSSGSSSSSMQSREVSFRALVAPQQPSGGSTVQQADGDGGGAAGSQLMPGLQTCSSLPGVDAHPWAGLSPSLSAMAAAADAAAAGCASPLAMEAAAADAAAVTITSGAGLARLNSSNSNSSNCSDGSSLAVLSGGAEGAVHGGELGEEALEGQVHGGRRSNSLTASGSLLQSLSSLPSSLADDLDTSSACTSPLRLAGAAKNSSSSSPWQRSSANSLMIVNRNGYDGGPSEFLQPAAADKHFQRQQRSLGVPAGRGTDAATAAAAMAAAAGRSFQSVDSGSLDKASTEEGLASGSNAIEVLQMPSGSFTRVKLAHSAPAAQAGCDNDTLGSTTLQQQRFAVSCLFREEQGSRLSNPAAVAAGLRASESAEGMRRSYSLGSAAPAVTKLTAGAQDGSTWSSARAASARTGNVGGNSFRPAFAAFASASARCQDTNFSSSNGNSYTDYHRKSSGSDSFQSKPRLSALGTYSAGPSFCASGDSSCPGMSSAAMEPGYRDAGLKAVSAAMAAAALLPPNVKRQRSTPLPPLAESPAPSPGSSPAVGPCYVSSYRQYMSQCQGQAAEGGNQSQQQQGDRSCGSSSEPVDIMHPGSFPQCPTGVAAAASTGSSSMPVSPEHSITGLVQSDDGGYDCAVGSRHPSGLGGYQDALEACLSALDGSDEALLLEPRGPKSFEFSRLMQ